MTKLTFDKKTYWIGFHPKLSYLIYDPLLQNAEWPGYVRLFVLKRNHSVPFRKDVVKKGLESVDKGVDYARQLATPYATAFRKLRETHCFHCLKNLLTSNFGICDRCGWIQCKCGSCACHSSKWRKHSYGLQNKNRKR